MSSSALRLHALAVLVLIFACQAILTPVSAVAMDAGQVQALLEAAQQIGITDWTAENLGEACDTRFAGIQCNDTGFVTYLYLVPNLIGPAPDSVSALVALQALTLYYNVNGTLPSSWSTLTQLESLRIGDYPLTMQLTGAVPESWSSMTSLKKLEIHFVDAEYHPSVTLIASASPSWLGNLESLIIVSPYWPSSALPASTRFFRNLAYGSPQ